VEDFPVQKIATGVTEQREGQWRGRRGGGKKRDVEDRNMGVYWLGEDAYVQHGGEGEKTEHDGEEEGGGEAAGLKRCYSPVRGKSFYTNGAVQSVPPLRIGSQGRRDREPREGGGEGAPLSDRSVVNSRQRVSRR